MANVNDIPCGEMRKESWNNLSQGKWGKAAVTTLVFFLMVVVIESVSKFIPIVGSLALYVVTPVLAYGWLVEMIKLKNGEEYSYVDFFKFGFEKFGMVWKVALRVALKLIVPIILIAIGSILMMVSISIPVIGEASDSIQTVNMFLSFIGLALIIAGTVISIPISYKYRLVNLEIYNNPDAEHSKDLVEKAGRLMVGHRFKFCLLELSFIGWALLGCLGFYIPFLWLSPFMEIAKLVFYDKLVEGSNDAITVNSNPIV